MSRRAVFARALRNRAMRRVLAAYLVFNVAEWADWIALLVWAYGRDGVRGASTLALLQLVPASLLAPAVSRLCERLSPRRALSIGYGTQALCYLSTGTALALSAPYPVVAGLAVASAVAITMTRPVHNTVLPLLADTTEELTAANTASGSIEALAAFLGPLASALLISVWGAGGVLLSVGVGSLVGAMMTLRLPARAAPVRVATQEDDAAPVRAVLANPTARTLTAVVAAEYVLVGMMDILLVALALDLLTMADSGPGLLTSAMGLGGIVGAGLTAFLVGRARLAPALLLGAVGAGLPIVVSGATSGALAAAALLVVAGAGKLYVDVAARTLVQRALPDRMLVAVFGVQEATMMAGLAVGSLAAPLLVASVGARWAFVAAGLFLPVVVLCVWPGLVRADRRATVPPEVFATLRRVPFLSVLTPRVVERLSLEAVERAEPGGLVVIREGEPGAEFYVLGSGAAEVTRDGEPLRRLGPGDWFGELALLRDAPRSATVALTEPSRLLVLGRAPFLTALTGAPQSLAVADEQAGRYDMGDGS